MRELDKELTQPIDKELYNILWSGNPTRSINDVIHDIKQAVETHVVGQTIDALDVGALTGPNELRASQSLTQAQAAYLMAHNGLVSKQRQSLWGDRIGSN